MNGQSDHPHVPVGVFTPQRPQPVSPTPIDVDDQSDIDSFIFHSPSPQITLKVVCSGIAKKAKNACAKSLGTVHDVNNEGEPSVGLFV